MIQKVSKVFWFFMLMAIVGGIQEAGSSVTSATRKVDIRIFDRSKTQSTESIERLLARANFKDIGYKKSVILTHQRSDDDIGETKDIRTVRFQKSIPCQNIAQVEKEIRERMPGVWGQDVSIKVRKEATRKREKEAKCDAGIEIHFPSKRCLRENTKRTAAGCSPACLLCFFLTQH
ncbi:uncharacterized protein LOC114950929 [Acropora millepora]|uniref:uncharacterized protein LOC114950929 n=1 Tax=Acropora millepora TaxID=45264 RepID=UPI001CF3298A|nr:uncharacterized protein LOC114950929 [Acropora millepora]